MGFPRNKIYLSAGDLTSCLRGVYYKKKKTPLPLVHPKIAEIWQLFGRLAEKGQEIQKRVTKEWQDQGILISPERFIPWNDYSITGKYDAIVKIDAKFVLYEIKGGGKTIFNNILETPEPYNEHRLQVLTYHYFLKQNFPGITARILYVERNGDKRLEIPIEYKEEEFLVIADRARKLIESLEKDELPEFSETITLSKFTGKYDINMSAITCKYHALCLNDDHWYDKALNEIRLKNN